MGLILMLFTIIAFAVGALVLVASILFKKLAITKIVVTVIAVWAVAYVSLLLAVSIFSTESNLSVGEKKRFCGFYLDCHVMFRATRVRSNPADPDTNKVEIEIEVSSDAKQAKLGLSQPTFTLIDRQGRSFSPVSGSTPVDELGRPIDPKERVRGKLLFEVPKTSGGLRLDIRKGGAPERFVELFLIGDEDSLLHKRTYFEIRPGGKSSPQTISKIRIA